ncbi:hypothetical protein LCL87_03505 [Rhodococcus hoagii]|nr:hypothetical protein [Prescottella equi]
MTKWLADLFIGIGEVLLTEQQRVDRGGIVIHAEVVHVTAPAPEVVEKAERVGLRDRLRFVRR